MTEVISLKLRLRASPSAAELARGLLGFRMTHWLLCDLGQAPWPFGAWVSPAVNWGYRVLPAWCLWVYLCPLSCPPSWREHLGQLRAQWGFWRSVSPARPLETCRTPSPVTLCSRHLMDHKPPCNSPGQWGPEEQAWVGASVVQSQPSPHLHLRSPWGGHRPSASLSLASAQTCGPEGLVPDSPGDVAERLSCGVRAWESAASLVTRG